MKTPDPLSVHKILVVRLSSIGDIILTTPLLRVLRKAYPKAVITYLVKKQFALLLAESPFIDELVAFDKAEGFAGLIRLKKQLKAQHFDLFLDIHGSLRSRFLRLGMHARLVTTYPKYILKRTLLIKCRVNLYRTVRPVYERYFDSVRKLNLRYDGLGTEIHVADQVLRKIDAWLASIGYSVNYPLIVICPGATYFNKRWKTEGFIETARYLIRERSAFIIVHGGSDDRETCEQIAAEAGPGAISAAGLFNLAESAALLRQGNLVIANDSGLLHLAQSQKAPVIGIYGPTTFELGFYPMNGNSLVIETNLSCRPCTPKGLNHCPKKHFRCMLDITAGQVIQACLTLLDNQTGNR